MDNNKDRKYFIKVKDPDEIMTCEDCLLTIVVAQYLSKTLTGQSICLSVARILKYFLACPFRIIYFLYRYIRDNIVNPINAKVIGCCMTDEQKKDIEMKGAEYGKQLSLDARCCNCSLEDKCILF